MPNLTIYVTKAKMAVIEEARRIAKGRGTSLSPYIVAAIEQRNRRNRREAEDVKG